MSGVGSINYVNLRDLRADLERENNGASGSFLTSGMRASLLADYAEHQAGRQTKEWPTLPEEEAQLVIQAARMLLERNPEKPGIVSDLVIGYEERHEDLPRTLEHAILSEELPASEVLDNLPADERAPYDSVKLRKRALALYLVEAGDAQGDESPIDRAVNLLLDIGDSSEALEVADTFRKKVDDELELPGNLNRDDMLGEKFNKIVETTETGEFKVGEGEDTKIFKGEEGVKELRRFKASDELVHRALHAYFNTLLDGTHRDFFKDIEDPFDRVDQASKQIEKLLGTYELSEQERALVRLKDAKEKVDYLKRNHLPQERRLWPLPERHNAFIDEVVNVIAKNRTVPEADDVLDALLDTLEHQNAMYKAFEVATTLQRYDQAFDPGMKLLRDKNTRARDSWDEYFDGNIHEIFEQNILPAVSEDQVKEYACELLQERRRDFDEVVNIVETYQLSDSVEDVLVGKRDYDLAGKIAEHFGREEAAIQHYRNAGKFGDAARLTEHIDEKIDLEVKWGNELVNNPKKHFEGDDYLAEAVASFARAGWRAKKYSGEPDSEASIGVNTIAAGVEGLIRSGHLLEGILLAEAFGVEAEYASRITIENAERYAVEGKHAEFVYLARRGIPGVNLKPYEALSQSGSEGTHKDPDITDLVDVEAIKAEVYGLPTEQKQE